MSEGHGPLTYPPMTVRIVRLGSKRLRDEGLRIGTVRKPPRGVPRGREDTFGSVFRSDSLDQFDNLSGPADPPYFATFLAFKYQSRISSPFQCTTPLNPAMCS